MTASIAIKKNFEILSKLTHDKIIIDCILTKNAKKMIQINKLKKIIKGKVFTDESEKNNKMLHIQLAQKSDLIVVCPATANIIAKFSNGYADDLASTSLIAANKDILVIPAMNTEMWNNKINKKNISKLKNMGIEFIYPVHGRLSCGDVGIGRLAEPKKICTIINQKLDKTNIFKNKKCLITAGPTIESIDAVRYISNYSSGKQGYEIAKQMISSGAKVTLISGPTNITPPRKAKIINIQSAKEMLKAVKSNSKVDFAIFVAAVSDASPTNSIKLKIKKEKLNNIKLKKNKDILYEISKLKKNRPKIVIGFAAETNNHIKNARKKLLDKKCDAIIVNKIDKRNKVFGSDFNKVSFITKTKTMNLNRSSKINIAKKIIKLIDNLHNN